MQSRTTVSSVIHSELRKQIFLEYYENIVDLEFCLFSLC